MRGGCDIRHQTSDMQEEDTCGRRSLKQFGGTCYAISVINMMTQSRLLRSFMMRKVAAMVASLDDAQMQQLAAFTKDELLCTVMTAPVLAHQMRFAS